MARENKKRRFTCNNRRRLSTAEDLFSLNDENRCNVVVVKRLRVERSFSLNRFDEERKVKLMLIKILLIIEHLRKEEFKDFLVLFLS
jgi:hypothetical protein